MSDSVLFTDAAALVIDELRAALEERDNDAAVGHSAPNPRPPAGFVLVRRVGGLRRDLVTDEPMLVIEAWHPSAATAHDLIQTARLVVHAMHGRAVDGVPVYRVTEVSGPAFLPDPLSDQPRYTMTVQVAVRGATEPAGS